MIKNIDMVKKVNSNLIKIDLSFAKIRPHKEAEPKQKTATLESSPEIIEKRPEVVKSITYKLKSAFVKYAIYVTLGYIEEPNGRKRPIEIFINSKDLTRAAEYAVLTRLISAIFRRTPKPTFILEELRSIYDPNGGYFKDQKYYPSIYAEIADIIEKFFHDIGILTDQEDGDTASSFLPNKFANSITANNEESINEELAFYKICPACNTRSLKYENGCEVCMNCGESKCDK